MGDVINVDDMRTKVISKKYTGEALTQDELWEKIDQAIKGIQYSAVQLRNHLLWLGIDLPLKNSDNWTKVNVDDAMEYSLKAYEIMEELKKKEKENA